jgi:hypothetical protein
MFATLQDRLAKEFERAGIATIAAANRFLREVYLPAHNARFARPPALPERAFVAAEEALLRLCVQEERVVTRDNTVAYRRPQTATAAEPGARPLRQGQGEGPPIPGRDARRVAWFAASGQLRRRRPAHRGTAIEGCGVNRFDAQPQTLVGLWTAASRPPTSPTSQQQQQTEADI